MKKSLTIIPSLLLCFYLSTHNANAQLGLKKLKNDAVKELKGEAEKKKDSMQNVLIIKLMDKTTSFCKPSKTEKIIINSTSKAYNAYSDMGKELDVIETKITGESKKGLLKNLKKLGQYVATIYAKEPNADLSTECDRLSSLQQTLADQHKF